MVTSSLLPLLPESSKASATDGLVTVAVAPRGGLDGTSMAKLGELSLRSTMPLDGGGGGTKWPGIL